MIYKFYLIDENGNHTDEVISLSQTTNRKLENGMAIKVKPKPGFGNARLGVISHYDGNVFGDGFYGFIKLNYTLTLYEI